MKRQTVLFDMDGVLVDSLPLWLAEFNVLLVEKGEKARVSESDIVSYNFAANPLIAKHKEEFFDLLESKQIFARSPAIESGTSRVFRYCDQPDSWDVKIVTYVHSACESGFQQKLEWLALWLPEFDLDNVIFVKDKSAVRGDILFEDNPDNISAWLEANSNGHALMVIHPYNVAQRDVLAMTFGERFSWIPVGGEL